MGEMVESIFKTSYVGFRPSKTWEPPVNVYERSDCFIVCVELAGMRRADIDVQVMPGQLIICGTRPDPQLQREQGPYRVHLLEIHHGEFSRAVELPSGLDIDKTQAKYLNGYLWIRLPKSET
jgi:HSP20 family protein